MNPDPKKAVGRMTEMMMPAPEQTKHWQIRIGSYRGRRNGPECTPTAVLQSPSEGLSRGHNFGSG